jgi:myosin-light-chain kinase
MNSILGVGSFGECRECVCRISGKVFAAKRTKSSKESGFWSARLMFEREVETLRSLSHPNVVRLVDFGCDDDHYSIVTDLCPGGELFHKILEYKRIPVEESVVLFSQVMRAIAYVHSQGIVHRDIKAENFLFAADGSLQLIDFGLSVRLKSDEEKLTAVLGSSHYVAPEMLRQRYSKPVDVWSAGVLLYLMLHGQYPFEGSEDQIFNQIKHRHPRIAHGELPVSGILLIQGLLEKDPAKRLTAAETLNHDFLLISEDATDTGSHAEIADAPLLVEVTEDHIKY